MDDDFSDVFANCTLPTYGNHYIIGDNIDILIISKNVCEFTKVNKSATIALIVLFSLAISWLLIVLLMGFISCCCHDCFDRFKYCITRRGNGDNELILATKNYYELQNRV